MSPGFRSARQIIRALVDEEKPALAKKIGAPHASDEALIAALRDPEPLQVLVLQAPDPVLAALRNWATESGTWPAVARASHIDGGIRALAEQGRVFETSYASRPTYLMPWDIMPAILDKLWDVPWDRLVRSGPPRQVPPAPVWSPIIHDLFQILSYARREPLLLTAGRDIYRRQRNKLDKVLWDRGHPPHPSAVDFLVFVLDRLGLFDLSTDPLSLTVSDHVTDFMRQDLTELFDGLASFAFDPTRLGWPGLVWACLASKIPPDASLVTAEVVSWMKSLKFSGSANQYLFNQAILELATFDFWESTEKGGSRLTDWAYSLFHENLESSQPASSLVQPTGEILVPPTAPLSDRWQLDGLASPVKSDRVTIYRIDQVAVRRAIQAGLSADKHAEGLKGLLKNPLPDNVLTNLRDWHRLLRRHRILEVTLIHSQTPNDSLAVETALQDDALGRLSPHDVIIARDRVKEVLKRLERAGMPLLGDVERPSLPRPSAPEPASHLHESWPVRLAPHAPVAQQSLQDIKELVQAATRHGDSLWLTYQPPGERMPREEAIYPVAAEPRWVQAYVVSQRRYVLIDWDQIVSVGWQTNPS